MYEDKSNEYFTHVRKDILAFLDERRFGSVLELGAGGCDTLVYMKKNKLAQKVTGVELFDLPNSNQKNQLIDELHLGSIENLHNYSLKANDYDLIICGDVLEHVFDPWSILASLRRYLSPDGIIVCSIPNFRDIQTMRKIFFQGDFRYNVEGGILDKTHVRFFCKSNMIDLFTNAGFEILSIAPNFKVLNSQKRRNMLNKITFGLFEEFFAFQYLILAK